MGAGAGEAEEAVVEAVGRRGGEVVAGIRRDGGGGGGVVEVVPDVEGRGRRHPHSRSKEVLWVGLVVIKCRACLCFGRGESAPPATARVGGVRGEKTMRKSV